jgi:starch synthase (maltosyl-transferring)
MPAADVDDRPEHPPSRVVILAVRPEVDGGRYPSKRVIDEQVEIEADLVADGHDIVRALLLHRPAGAAEWQEIEMVAAGNDVWRASFVATALGRHAYTVIAWVDAFTTWRRGLERKVQAGNDVSV